MPSSRFSAEILGDCLLRTPRQTKEAEKITRFPSMENSSNRARYETLIANHLSNAAIGEVTWKEKGSHRKNDQGD